MVVTAAVVFLIGTFNTFTTANPLEPTEIIIEKHINPEFAEKLTNYGLQSGLPPFISNFMQHGTNFFFKPQFMLSPTYAAPNQGTIIENKEDYKKWPTMPAVPFAAPPQVVMEEPVKIVETVVTGEEAPVVDKVVVIKPPISMEELSDHYTLHIPEAPELLPYLPPPLPVPVVLPENSKECNKTPALVEIQSEDIKIPEAPILPEVMPETVILPEYPPALIDNHEAVIIPQPPILPFPAVTATDIIIPQPAPESNIVEITPVEIPHAPVLPEVFDPVLPGVIPQAPLPEKVGETSVSNDETKPAEPSVIPPAPELPPLSFQPVLIPLEEPVMNVYPSAEVAPVIVEEAKLPYVEMSNTPLYMTFAKRPKLPIFLSSSIAAAPLPIVIPKEVEVVDKFITPALSKIESIISFPTTCVKNIVIERVLPNIVREGIEVVSSQSANYPVFSSLSSTIGLRLI